MSCILHVQVLCVCFRAVFCSLKHEKYFSLINLAAVIKDFPLWKGVPDATLVSNSDWGSSNDFREKNPIDIETVHGTTVVSFPSAISSGDARKVGSPTIVMIPVVCARPHQAKVNNCATENFLRALHNKHACEVYRFIVCFQREIKSKCTENCERFLCHRSDKNKARFWYTCDLGDEVCKFASLAILFIF